MAHPCIFQLLIYIYLFMFHQGRRGESFSPEENLILSKCFIKISGNSIVGTNQAHVQFWVRITSEYNKTCEIANNQSKEEQEEGVFKYIERTLDSLKSRWMQKILSAVKKFQGICETNPPTWTRITGEWERCMRSGQRQIHVREIRRSLRSRHMNVKSRFVLHMLVLQPTILLGNDKNR